MSFQEKVESAKDSKFLGLKGLYRKSKQACMEKMGKGERIAEAPEFRSCVDKTNAMKVAYKTIVTSVESIAGAVEGFNINFKAMADSFESLSKTLSDGTLSRTLNTITPGFREICEYSQAFSRNAKTNIVPVFEKFTKTAVEDLEKKKKEYNSVRYEHDEVKHSLDKAMGKPLKGANQEKINRLQRDYESLHEKYLQYQTEYIAKAHYLEAIIQRDAGLAILNLAKELTNWSGQVYRIFSQQSGTVDASIATLSSLPEPKLVNSVSQTSTSGATSGAQAMTFIQPPPVPSTQMSYSTEVNDMNPTAGEQGTY